MTTDTPVISPKRSSVCPKYDGLIVREYDVLYFKTRTHCLNCGYEIFNEDIEYYLKFVEPKKSFKEIISQQKSDEPPKSIMTRDMTLEGIKKRHNHVLDMIAAGEKIETVVKETGLSESRVKWVLFEKLPRGRTKEDIYKRNKIILGLHNQGMPAMKIATLLDRDYDSVRKIVKKYEESK